MGVMEHMRDRLTDLQGMAQQTAAVERQLLAYAQQRLAEVRADIDKLRVRAATDQGAAEACHDLIVEAGRLEQVIANARSRAA